MHQWTQTSDVRHQHCGRRAIVSSHATRLNTSNISPQYNKCHISIFAWTAYQVNVAIYGLLC